MRLRVKIFLAFSAGFIALNGYYVLRSYSMIFQEGEDPLLRFILGSMNAAAALYLFVSSVNLYKNERKLQRVRTLSKELETLQHSHKRNKSELENLNAKNELSPGEIAHKDQLESENDLLMKEISSILRELLTYSPTEAK